MKDCLFCRIVKGEIPAKKVYEDEHTFAFEDLNPQAPTHVLIVPKKHVRGLTEVRPVGLSHARAPDRRAGSALAARIEASLVTLQPWPWEPQAGNSSQSNAVYPTRQTAVHSVLLNA